MIRLFLRSWQVLLLLATLTISVEATAYNEAKLYVERLPDMNIPRTGHSTLTVDGMPMVFGGHTSGFVPTKTAEYLENGKWNEMPMSYIHAQGVIVPMKSGKIIIAGGHEQELGIGQTFTFEIYDPQTRTFDGYGCLENKRCFAEGLEMDSGKVIITGNWYHTDCIELFDGTRQCLFVKDVAQQRSIPYIFKTAADNAIIFGSYDLHGEQFDSIIIDRLKGDPFTEPLFSTWRPFYNQMGHANQDMFIGDEAKGEYAYLLTAVNAEGQVAFVKAVGEQFSLLPTEKPIPMHSQWGPINWFSYVVADRKVHHAYIVGYGEANSDRRLYVLQVDYASEPSSMTLYTSEPIDSIGCRCPVLTTDGCLLMAGGVTIPGNNYNPQPSVLLLRFTPVEESANNWLWLWGAILAAAIIIAIVVTVLYRRRKASHHVRTVDANSEDLALMEQLRTLMESQQLYLRKDLRVSDVADEMGIFRGRLSDIITTQQGCSFQQFVNTYRIKHAQQLMISNPDMKMSAVCLESGFANEVTFFRVFKTIIGKTPTEWKSQL